MWSTLSNSLWCSSRLRAQPDAIPGTIRPFLTPAAEGVCVSLFYDPKRLPQWSSDLM